MHVGKIFGKRPLISRMYGRLGSKFPRLALTDFMVHCSILKMLATGLNTIVFEKKNFKSTLQAVQLGRMVLSDNSEYVLEDSNGV